MDLKSLEALGITAEDLTERIVERAVDDLLNSTGFDPENDEEVRYESRFKKEIEKRIQTAVDVKIGALAAEHLLPRLGQMIETANLRRTNHYGEPKGEPMTFIEYIANRADAYMTEDVDYHGKSKAELETRGESTYQWRSCGPRITVLMRSYIHDHLEKSAKTALVDVNKVFVTAIQKSAQDAIASAAAALKVSVSA